MVEKLSGIKSRIFAGLTAAALALAGCMPATVPLELVLFAGMLALAVSNRFWIVPSLAKARTDRLSVWTARLRNHVLCEQLLGLIVLLIVSVLGTMRPAIAQ